MITITESIKGDRLQQKSLAMQGLNLRHCKINKFQASPNLKC